MSEKKIDRLRELSRNITTRPRDENFMEEFSIRIPVDEDRDADMVLWWAADTIESITAERDALKAEVERLRQWYTDSHRIIDEWDTKCSALRAENEVMEDALRINHIRIHIWKTGFHWWIVPKSDWDLAKTLPVIMRETEPPEQPDQFDMMGQGC